jgi:hypothetical protein
VLERIVKSPNETRAGSKEGVVRYVLVVSLALVVILFIVAYVFSLPSASHRPTPPGPRAEERVFLSLFTSPAGARPFCLPA